MSNKKIETNTTSPTVITLTLPDDGWAIKRFKVTAIYNAFTTLETAMGGIDGEAQEGYTLRNRLGLSAFFMDS